MTDNKNLEELLKRESVDESEPSENKHSDTFSINDSSNKKDYSRFIRNGILGVSVLSLFGLGILAYTADVVRSNKKEVLSVDSKPVTTSVVREETQKPIPNIEIAGEIGCLDKYANKVDRYYLSGFKHSIENMDDGFIDVPECSSSDKSAGDRFIDGLNSLDLVGGLTLVSICDYNFDDLVCHEENAIFSDFIYIIDGAVDKDSQDFIKAYNSKFRDGASDYYHIRIISPKSTYSAPTENKKIVVIDETNNLSKNNPKSFTSSIKINENNVFNDAQASDIYYNEGIIFLENNDFENAISMFKKSLEKNKSLDAFYHLSEIYIDLKDYDNAEKIFKESIEFDPKHFQSYFNLSSLYYNTNKPKLMEDILLKGYKATSNEKIAGKLESVYLLQNDFENALKFNKELMKHNPLDPQTIQNYAQINYVLGNFDESLKYFEKAIEVNEPYIAVLDYNYIGNIYMKKNDFKKAKEAYNKALEINPEFKPAKNNLEVIISKQNDI